MRWDKLKPWRFPCKYHDSASRLSEVIVIPEISKGLAELDDMSITYADITPFDSDERIKTIVQITPTTSGWKDSNLWRERRGVVTKRFILLVSINTTLYTGVSQSMYDTLQEAYVAFTTALNDINVYDGKLLAKDAILPLATFNKRSDHE